MAKKHIKRYFCSVQFSLSVVSNSVTPWTAAPQASLSITNSWSLLKYMSIESVLSSNHLILVNEAEVGVFLELSCFFNDPMNVGNLISCFSPFSKSSLNIWSSQFTYCWSQAWRIFSITLLACEMCAIVQQFEHSLTLRFFEIGMKTDLFQSCGHHWVFQICWNNYQINANQRSITSPHNQKVYK